MRYRIYRRQPNQYQANANKEDNTGSNKTQQAWANPKNWGEFHGPRSFKNQKDDTLGQTADNQAAQTTQTSGHQAGAQPIMPKSEEEAAPAMQSKGEDEEAPAMQAQGEEEDTPDMQAKGEEEDTPAMQAKGEDEEAPAMQAKGEDEEAPAMQAKGEEDDTPAMQAQGWQGQPGVNKAFAEKLKSTFGQGKPLPKKICAEMQAAFGADFSQVRIHDGKAAQELCKAIHAQAFTHKAHIYFNVGRFNPDTTAGKRLLAHELAHTIQQSSRKK